MPPRKPRNKDRRGREHLTPAEIDRLMAAAGKAGRHGHRDATMILVAYRHGLRVSELVALRWDQVDLDNAMLHVRRRKNGIPSTHPLRGSELRALRKLARENGAAATYVFASERKAPMTEITFRRVVARAGALAEIGMPIHPHMLRHYVPFRTISGSARVLAARGENCGSNRNNGHAFARHSFQVATVG